MSKNPYERRPFKAEFVADIELPERIMVSGDFVRRVVTLEAQVKDQRIQISRLARELRAVLNPLGI